MRISTLAVCTLATIAAQDFAQPASAHLLSNPASEVNPRVIAKSPAATSLPAMAVSKPIATVQVEFSQPAPSRKAAPQPSAPAAIAQTTTIDELETPSAPEPEPEPGNPTDPQAPDRPSAPASPSGSEQPGSEQPGSEQYLQEEPPPIPTPSPTPLNSQPAPSPLPPSPPPSPSPSGLVTEPIAPTVQIGNVILPHRGALPAGFVFPIRIRVTVESSISTNTPITNATEDLATWEERIRACLDEKPQLFAVQAGGALVPILFDGQPGSILRNANGRMVCSSIN